MKATRSSQLMIIFLSCLMKVVEIQAHCNRPTIAGNRILTAESDKPVYTDGETADFQCLPGYESAWQQASRTITCNGKQWTQLQLQCRKKSCGRLVEIPNGKYLYPEGTLFGARTTVKCNAGYQLVGENARICQDAGWDGKDPICEERKVDVERAEEGVTGTGNNSSASPTPSHASCEGGVLTDAVLKTQTDTLAAIEKLTHDIQELKGIVSEMSVTFKEFTKSNKSRQA